MQLHQNILDSVTKSAFNVSRPNHLPTDTYSPEPPIQRDGILAKMGIGIRNVGGVTLNTEETTMIIISGICTSLVAISLMI